MIINIKIISLFSQLVAGLFPLAVLFYKSLKFNLEFLLYLLSSILATFGFIYTSIYKLNNSWIFDCFQVCTIFFLTIFYYRLININLCRVIFLILGLLSLTSFIYELKTQGYTNWSLTILNVNFIICPIIYLIFSISKSNSEQSKSLEIINFSILIYYSTVFILFYFLEIIFKNNVWYVHNIVESASKLLIAYAFWKLPKTSLF